MNSHPAVCFIEHPAGLPETKAFTKLCDKHGLDCRVLDLNQPADDLLPRAVVVFSLEPLVIDQLSLGPWLQASFDAGGWFLTLGAAGTLLADLAGAVMLPSPQPTLGFERVSLNEEGELDPLASTLTNDQAALICSALDSRGAPGLTTLAYAGNFVLMERYLERGWGVRGFPWVTAEWLEFYLRQKEFIALMDLCRTLPTQLRLGSKGIGKQPAGQFEELVGAFLAEASSWLTTG